MSDWATAVKKYDTNRRPQPNIALGENTSPAPSGFGRNRSGLNRCGSWNLFSSHVILLRVQLNALARLLVGMTPYLVLAITTEPLGRNIPLYVSSFVS